jgi:predicted nuclease of predicted toxin-antitoxin system
VLGPSAPDNAIAAYARSQDLWIVTKDVEFARRCRVNGFATLWLRTRQIEDAERLDERIVEVMIAVSNGAAQLVLTRGGTLEVDLDR